MTQREFYKTIIKATALVVIVTIVLKKISQVFYNEYSLFNFSGIIGATVFVVVMAFLFKKSIEKLDVFLDWLKIDEGKQNETVDLLNIKSEVIFKIGVLVVGGLLIVENIPPFISDFLFALEKSAQEDFEKLSSADDFKIYTNTLIKLVNIILGYYMIKSHQRIVGFFTKGPYER